MEKQGTSEHLEICTSQGRDRSTNHMIKRILVTHNQQVMAWAILSFASSFLTK